ncbi:amino acid adenylation domain-containing protein [Actinomadura formosensis]|uniref:amino acid adenylation domain-containing protein n=1 Tax=Actinomadura formosensis TaxID=60706 RepID=UPI00083458C0|nr:amino acid adenylation domain-containing protein [Actinomadura formosensis]
MRTTASTLAHAFREVAARFPERTAVTAPDGELTYRRLDERSDALAGRLAGRGVQPGDVVSLLAPRGTGLIVGMVGILKAGAAYLPIDPEYPETRVSWMVRDSGSRALVSVSDVIAGLSRPVDAKVVLLDPPSAEAGTEPPAGVPGDADSVAYVIYTSGSTGEPKGVQVEHRSVLHLFEATKDMFKFRETDVWSVFHSAAFDFSVWEIWGALLYGGQMVLVPRETTRSDRAFHGLLREHGVTVLNQTPSAFRLLSAADEHAEHKLDALRLVILGGERLDPPALRPWLERYGDENPRLVNMYGITEATVHASYRPLGHADLAGDGPSPIGSPLPGITFHVLDDDQAPVPPGVPGELYIEGPQITRGYLNRPHLDAERLRGPDGPDGVPRRRLRTGDRVVMAPSGDYRYLGRVDDQIQLRGYRIEPGEIESVLSGFPEVAQAAVVPRDYGEGDVRLTAYVTGPGAGPALGTALRERVAATLPQHMCPSHYVVLDELPLTVNGKVDRDRLPDPEHLDGDDRAAGHRGTEERVSEIWRTILNVPEIPLDADFFHLGGNSLSLLRMFTRVNTAFGIDMDITVLVGGATVRNLSAQINLVTAETAGAQAAG